MTTATKRIAHEKLIIFTIGLAMLMEFIDVSVLNTSLPQIAYSLKVNPIDLKVALTVYLLALGAFIPAAGWVADRFGVRKILLIAIAGFLLSSIMCGLSTTLWMLTLARAAQGICGAFISPVARLMVLHLFKTRLAEVMAKIVPIFLLGPLLGPLVGGAITTQLNWRFIFFVNVPVGLFAWLMIRWRFPRYATSASRFDSVGFFLLAMALALALLSIDTITLPTLSPLAKFGFIIISLLLFMAYYWHYRKSHSPLINLAVFHVPSYAYFSFLLVMIRLFSMSMGFVGPLYVQTHYHYTAWESGLMVAPIVLGALVAKRTLVYLRPKLALRLHLTSLLAISIFIFIALGYVMLHFSVFVFVGLLFINGWCIGQLMPLIAQSVYRDLDKRLASTGSVINSAITQLTQGFAIALIAMILIVTSRQPALAWHTVLPNCSYAIVMFFNAAMLLIAVLSLPMLMPKNCDKDL